MSLADELRLKADQLRFVCSPDRYDFKTTADLPYIREIIGQPRGTRAIEFGVKMDSPGFNVYVLGPTGTGRATAIKQFLEEYAQTGETPLDWVYVNNFEVEHQPRAIELSPGLGAELQTDMASLVDVLRQEIPRALGEEAFNKAMQGIADRLNEKRGAIFQAVSNRAQEQGFAIMRTPSGLAIVPVKDGEPMPPEALEAMEQEERKALEDKRSALGNELESALREVRELEKAAKQEQDALEREAAAFVVDQHLGDLKEKYANHEEMQLYLGQVREDILSTLEDFTAEGGEEEQSGPMPPIPPAKDEEKFRRYAVNLIVSHAKTEGAPVVLMEMPTYQNLVGRIEGEVRMGTLNTDFTGIKPGALHRANGGYLIVRARDLLSQPFAWDGLKHALAAGEIRIEDTAQRTGVGVLVPQTIDPEPIPLNIKVILLGSPSLYYLLYATDEAFSDLFKVKSDFSIQMERTSENEERYALFIAARCREENLLHFDRSAVARVVMYGSRLAQDQGKLSTLFGNLADLIREAAYWAKQYGVEVVSGEHVERAIQEGRYRVNLFEDLTMERIREGTVFIDTAGEVVGQVNGLSVVGLGDYLFGQPSRITARVYMGREGVVNIEREVALSGPIHDKGVLTLRGYLGGQYAGHQPLSLTASITFEQNYAGVEGDSASLAELCALLSALSGCPLRQDLAVTGSINQRGEVQPVGGVSDKIEGFFRICQTRGLTGQQGAIIPQANIRNLMLNEEVVEATVSGSFHIYGVAHADQAVELLTGLPAGERQADGTYDKGTTHRAVQDALRAFAEELRRFTTPGEP
jgi:lon-related putative ATP-dependent protease